MWNCPESERSAALWGTTVSGCGGVIPLHAYKQHTYVAESSSGSGAVSISSVCACRLRPGRCVCGRASERRLVLGFQLLASGVCEGAAPPPTCDSGALKVNIGCRRYTKGWLSFPSLSCKLTALLSIVSFLSLCPRPCETSTDMQHLQAVLWCRLRGPCPRNRDAVKGE